jgi:tetratricopeptide (TPR) repeat protein
MPKSTLILILLAATTLFFSACTDPEQIVQKNLLEAQKLEQEGFLDDALILLTELDQKYPGRQDVLEPLAFVYAQMQMNAHAADAFLRIAEIDADNDLYYLYAADQQSLAGNDNDAIHHYRQYILKHPKDADTLQKLGDLLLKRNRYQDAIQYLNQKQQVSPSGQTALSLAQAFLALSNINQAQYWFEVSYRLDPKQELSALSGLVEIAIQNNQFDQAEELLKKLEANYPQEVKKEPLLSLSQQLAKFRKEHEIMQQMLSSNSVSESTTTPAPAETSTTEVAVVAEQAVTETPPTEASPETVTPASEVSTTVVTTSETETAVATESTSDIPAEQITISSNKNLLPEQMLAEVEKSLQEETADKSNSTPVEEPSSPTNTEATEPSVTISEIEVGEEDAAGPSIDTSDLDLARQLVQEGNLQAAAAAYWKFLSRHDQDAAVWSELSDVFLKMDQLQPARAVILEALRRDPQNMKYVFQNLEIAQRLESPDNYLRALQQTRIQHPRNPDIALALARNYAKRQDRANSEFYYREFIRLSNPEHPSRQEAEGIIGISAF